MVEGSVNKSFGKYIQLPEGNLKSGHSISPQGDRAKC